jgi:hypothetical protein
MKAFAALLLTLPLTTFANPTVPPDVKPAQTQTQRQKQKQQQGQAQSAFSYSDGSTALSSSGSQAISGGNSVGLTASPTVEFKAATAPDIITYPTAPCLNAGGVSAGWFGGSVGITSSSRNDECALINKSVALHNLGLKEAAVQVMCLDDESRMALEATGVKCLISKPQQQEPQPRITP